MTLQQLGTFRILKKLGEGGMGAVYLAEDTAAQRKVALKVLPTQLFSQTEFIKRFYREARATGKLNHPNIVSAYTVGEEQGLHYYVMEYCPGRSLDRLIAERGAIPWREATGIILQVAAGLQHAHERNFIHRDIKPHNVILGDDGVAKILDMGLTKNIGDVEQSFNTQSGAMLGTPHYIAPEQARGESSIDGRVDIYSLGATYFHLVTGKTPYNGPTAMAIIARHMTEAPPDASAVNSHVPHAVAYVIKRMMAKSPDDRHRDCAQLIQDLEQLRDGHVPATMASAVDGATETMAAIQAPPPSRPSGGQTVADEQRSGVDRRVNDRRGDRDTAPREPEKRTAFLIAAAAATVLLAIVVGILIGRRGTQSPPAAPSPAAASPAPAGIPVEETSQQPPAVSIPEPAKPPPPVTPLPAQAPAAAGEWVNLLPLVDPRRDTRNGQWFADNGTLRSAVSHYTTIQFPYRPPEEYDFRVTFTVQEG
ncbi:MAG TPA: serine/threonine-protein kinase, partial [Planctomycetota bacterium]|nr:serine/threonine-protein kinase [Planctomycetota bacterium]